MVARRSAAIALLLSVLVAGQALAVTWGATVPLTTNRNAEAWFGLGATGASTVHVAYENASGGILGVYYRRSTNGGTTFGTPVRLSSTSSEFSATATLAASGSQVDVVWQDFDLEAGIFDVKYRRSLDQGVTWQGTAKLNATPATTPSIARDTTGRVIAAWTDRTSGAITVRVSANNGATWGGAKTIGTSHYVPFDNGRDGLVAVAAGSGVLYAVWWDTPTALYVQRSIDGGASWSAKATLTTAGAGDPASVAANGSSAVVAYAEQSASLGWVATRRTTNKGSSWASRVALTSTTSGNDAFAPVIRYGGGRWRAAMERCADPDCTSSAVWYKDSADAVTWSTIQKVSTSAREYAIPDGITWAGRPIVLYHDLAPDVDDTDLFVRLGT